MNVRNRGYREEKKKESVLLKFVQNFSLFILSFSVFLLVRSHLDTLLKERSVADVVYENSDSLNFIGPAIIKDEVKVELPKKEEGIELELSLFPQKSYEMKTEGEGVEGLILSEEEMLELLTQKSKLVELPNWDKSILDLLRVLSNENLNKDLREYIYDKIQKGEVRI